MLDRRSNVLVCALALLAPACSGERGEDFESQTLTRVSAGNADECENGALHIETGLDTNKNGVLDDDEVQAEQTQTVCQGEMITQSGEIRRVDPIAEGDTRCPDGGIVISVGMDDNKDAKLEDNEVDSTDVVCNSERPHAVLTKAVTLPVGDANCRYGGRRIDAGLDDGAGEGKPDDNELADDEVDSSYFDCNATAPDPVDPLTPPQGEPGKAVIDARGGSFAEGLRGGNGGVFGGSARDAAPCTPATTRIFPTGTVDASFKVPEFAIDLGDEPLVVTKDMTIEGFPEVPVVGSYYYQTIVISDRALTVIARWTDTGAVAITGLRVQEGVTLTVPAGMRITLPFDVEILGSLLTGEVSENSLNLASTGVLRVGPKGRVEIPHIIGSSTLALSGGLALAVEGTVMARGVAAGVAGADVSLSSEGRIYLAGTIDVSGADSDTAGGSGGSVHTTAGAGGVWSSAFIDASGGDGHTVGGQGGEVQLGSDPNKPLNVPLDVRNSGRIDVSGGVQTACATPGTCEGGRGGEIFLSAVNAPLVNSGELDASGGDSEERAGAGQTIALTVLDPSGQRLSNIPLTITGNLLARGGAATKAGGISAEGGSVRFENCTGSGSSADFVGYAGIQLEGGAANSAPNTRAIGGNGGHFLLSADDAESEAGRLYLYVPVTANAGDGLGTQAGGTFTVRLVPTLAGRRVPAEIPSVIIGSDVALHGATSQDLGNSSPGLAQVQALGSVQVSGSIAADGGSNGSEGETTPGSVSLSSVEGAVTVSGSVSANGSSSSKFSGGRGGCVNIEGRTVNLSGKLSARGGAGAADNASSVGGYGGQISYISHDASAQLGGMLDVSGGEGSLKGHDGLAGPDLPFCGL
jgi:hypothetical protein